ncbi:MAG: CdaR family protein [Synergistaceae bacterium]|nr:CdaR family protein [Synergistaceae bacterium]
MKNNSINNGDSPKKFQMIQDIGKKYAEKLKRWISIRGTGRLRSNLGLFAVSLAISLMLWAFVAWDGNSDGTRSMSASIEYLNLQRGYSMYENTRKVEIRLAGRLNALSRVEQTDITARVDLQGLQPGKYSLPINISTPPFVRLRSWQPSTADVEIYRHVERTVSISHRVEGNLPEGMAISSLNILPKEAVISGPESDVLAVQALETVIPGSKIKDGESIMLPVTVSSTSGSADRITITPKQVGVTVNLENEILRESIPVEVSVVGTPADGYELESVLVIPESVAIKGKSTAVKKMTSLVLPPVDISGLDQNLNLMLPLQPVEMTPEVEISGPDRARVEIYIRKKIAEKTYNNVGVMTEGSVQGKEWKISPQFVKLTIQGTKSEIDALSSGAVPCDLYVDVSNIVSKQLNLPVLVKNLGSDFKVLRIEPEQVTVTAVD